MAIDLAADADFFMDGFEESVVFVPHDGSPFSITAVVDRLLDVGSSPDLAGTSGPQANVHTPTTELVSGLGRQPDKMRDKIRLAMRHGETATLRAIGEVSEKDAGITVLACR